MHCLAAGLSVAGIARAEGPPTIAVGPMEAYPILSANVGYATNVIKEESGNDLNSWVLQVPVGGGLQGMHREHLYGIEYEGTVTRYNESPADNAFDQRVTAYGGHAFDVRNNIDVGAEYLDRTDPRGYDDVTGGYRDSRGSLNPDEWHQGQIGATYVYGAPNARGRIECTACQTWRRYDNNDQEYRDLDLLDLGLTFGARVQPKTSLLLGVAYSDFNYLNEAPADVETAGNLDSTETRYFAGAEWETTRKTSAIVKAGWLEKDFDDPDVRDSYGDPWWSADVRWAPRESSNFGAGFSRYLYEAVPYTLDDETVDEDFVQVQDLHLDWSQRWREDISSTVAAYRRWEDWSPSGRSDDVYGISAGLSFPVSRWLNVGLGGYYRSRDSSDPDFDYDDSGVSLSLQLLGGWNARSPFACQARGSGYYQEFYSPGRGY